MNPLTKSTFIFLKELDENNNKNWFDANRTRYEKAHLEMISFAEIVMTELMIADKIENRSGKKTLYRIYRDVRFSKDKTPYKNKWGGQYKRVGENRRGGFHFDIQPGGKSFVAGGFWGPNKEDLQLLREHLANDSEPLKKVIKETEFVSCFGEIKGQKLKTGPKGFDKDHKEIELLKLKQYLVFHSFSDEDVLSEEFPLLVAQTFTKMIPFLDVMTDYLTTDLNGSSLLK